MDDVAAKLEERIRHQLRFLAKDETLDPSVELRELGLDSMGALDLIQDVEQTFGIRFPDELLVEDTFRTAGALTKAVRGLLEG